MRKDRERLADILEAAQKIQSRVDRGRERFDADEDMQIVLTHLVLVIGKRFRVSRREMRPPDE